MSFKYDFQAGLLREWREFAILACGAFIICKDFRDAASLQSNIVYTDYLFLFLKGIPPYVHESAPFELPIQWFTLQIYLAFIVGKYLREDLYGRGIYVLVRTKSRAGWWISKVFWCIVTCVVYYAVLYLAVLAFCIVFKIRMETVMRVAGNSTSFFYVKKEIAVNSKAILLMLLIPIAASVAMSLLELAVIIVAGAFAGLFAVCILLTASAYYCHPLLLGNMSMLERITDFSSQTAGGISLQSGLSACLAISVCSVLAGGIYFSRTDMLWKES